MAATAAAAVEWFTASEVATGVATAVAGGVAGAATASMLAPKPKDLPIPEVKPVTPMPDPLAQDEAKRKSIIDQMARRGRASTILTDSGGGGSTLGGG